MTLRPWTFMEMMSQVSVVCYVVGHQRFGAPCCLHVPWPSETLISYITTRCHNPDDCHREFPRLCSFSNGLTSSDYWSKTCSNFTPWRSCKWSWRLILVRWVDNGSLRASVSWDSDSCVQEVSPKQNEVLSLFQVKSSIS